MCRQIVFAMWFTGVWQRDGFAQTKRKRMEKKMIVSDWENWHCVVCVHTHFCSFFPFPDRSKCDFFPFYFDILTLCAVTMLGAADCKIRFMRSRTTIDFGASIKFKKNIGSGIAESIETLSLSLSLWCQKVEDSKICVFSRRTATKWKENSYVPIPHPMQEKYM